MRLLLALLAALILTGCAGKPTTYLTLAPVLRGMTQRAAGLTHLAVGQVDIPPAIDRPQLTTGAAPGTLHVAGKAQWAGPLGPMARIVLAQDLAARLPGCDVLMPGDAMPPGGAPSLHVTIQDFMPDASGTVRLQADWSLVMPGEEILRRGRFAHAFTGPARPGAEAQEMSRALATLADAIASRLASAT